MNLSKTITIRELAQTITLIKKNAFLYAIAAIIDALFFFAYGFFTTFISDSITAHSALISNKLSELLAQKKLGILKLLFQDPLRPLTGKLILLILLFFALSFIVYTIFQATSWWIARTIAGKKENRAHFFLTFVKLNLLWFGLYVFYRLANLFLSLRFLVIKRFEPGAYDLGGVILLGLLAFLVITALLSYATLQRWSFFKLPLRTTLPLITICIVIFLNAQFLTDKLSKLFLLPSLSATAYYLNLAWLAIIFCSFLVFLKIYATLVLSHVRS